MQATGNSDSLAEPAEAAGGRCPINICPSNLSGWNFVGGCTIINGTIEGFCCDVYQLPHHSFSKCRTNCMELY